MEETQVPTVSPDTVKAAMDAHEQFILLDVRTPGEVSRGKIAGSINLPTDEVVTRISEVVPDTHAKIYVYCLSANRSASVVAYMRSVGYTDVWNMQYGILGWRAKYFPVES